MIDAEVIRLRRLRNTVLRTRALAQVLDSQPGRPNSVLARSARECWRIARVATGKLREHPYLAYQRGPGELRTLYNRFVASLRGGIALRLGRPSRIYAVELQQVSRELDDVRALTWSPELSDALGRAQMQIRGLAAEVDIAARKEGGAAYGPARMGKPVMARDRADSSRVSGPWPYLAI